MTETFLETILAISKDEIPGKTYDHARRCLLDYLACAVAGAKMYASIEERYLTSLLPENGSSIVLGRHIRSNMQTAALINGISAHAVELDDGHRIGMMHPGAPVISALLAVAEKEQVNSDDFLYGIIVGYEAAIRLACAIQPACKLKGFHATGICGTLGGAIGIGAMLGFNQNQMKSAFAAAISSASGVLEMIEGDTQLKPFNAGNAAMSAISSAFIGKAGFRPPKDPLGGKRGFLKVFSDNVRTEYLTDPNGSYYIETIYNKPYASCRHTHAAIEAALCIREQEGFNIKEVESIDVATYRLAVSGHDHTAIEGVNSAKMSIPYSVAVALHTGKAGLPEFGDFQVSNTDILDLASKVSVSERADLTVLCPEKRVAEVAVKTESGIYGKRIEYPKGEPENPLTHDEFIQKVTGLMLFAGYTEETVEKSIATVNKESFEIKELTGLLW